MRFRNFFRITLIAAAVLFAGCSSESESHGHSWSTEYSSDAATHWHKCSGCAEIKDKAAHTVAEALSKNETNHWKVCEVCSKEYETAEHNFGNWQEVTAATEEADGLEKRVCDECGYEETRSILQLNHTHKFAAEWTAGETTHWHAATCSHDEKSEETSHLTTAELSKDQTNHWKVCDVCGGKYDVTAHTEDTGTVTTMSTCVTKGVRTYKCTVCEEVLRTEEISEKGHLNTTGLSKDGTNHWKVCDVCGGKYDVTAHTEDTGTVTTAPTCVTKGVKTYKCTVCEEVLRTEEVAALGHIEDTGTVTTAPTCVTKGVRTFKCTVCEEVLRTEEIPELYSSPVDAETGLAATSSSNYIYFGVFPKTVLPKTSTVTVDETVSVSMGANTYYKGSDGNYYAKVKENCYESSGYTYTDGTTVKQSEANSYRYFKVEPVKWKVLTNNYNNTDKALLLAEDILTADVPYFKSLNNRTVGSDTDIYANNYKYSQIRAYLNGLCYYDKPYDFLPQLEETEYTTGNGFLQTAFTTTAQALIADTEVDNRKETTGYSESTYAADYACENTTDKIFLLSESEVINSDYGFAAYNSKGQGNARIRVTTDFAKANYAWQSTTAGYGGWWWQRSPHYCSSIDARIASYDGNVSSRNVSDSEHGVVPALSISF